MNPDDDAEEDPRIAARKAAFKAGPDGTRKREEAQLSIRKNKRAAALLERRSAQPALVQNTPLVAVSPNEWEQAMRERYRREALLAGDPAQLELLATLLDRATREQKERFLPALLWNAEGTEPVVLRYLVARACSNPNALKALLGATVHLTSHDIVCATTIFQAGYLDMLAQALKEHAMRMPPNWHAALWDVVSNLAISSDVAQRTIAEHPVMGPTMAVAAFRWANEHHHGIIQRALVYVMRTLVTEDSIFTPSVDFLCSTFVPLLEYLMNEVQADNWRHMDAPSLATLRYAADALRIYIRRIPHPEKEARLCPILNHVGIERIMAHLCAVCEAQNGDRQAALVSLLGEFSIFRLPENQYHWAAYRKGVFRLLVQSATRPGDESVRAKAFRALGNYVADDFGFVGPLIEAGIMPAMLMALRREKRSVREQALYMLANLFVMCDDTRRHNMQMAEQAVAIMRTLIERERILNFVCPFIDPLTPDPTRDAVDILQVALEWDAAFVMQTIAGEEAEDRIHQLLPTVKGQAQTWLFNKIMRIEELMGRGHSEAAFEEDVEMLDPATTDGRPFFF
jgi:hypothetical protein